MSVAFVNGCFDVLHIGHIELFRYAKAQAEKVFVAIDSDARVRSMKGEKRPFNNQHDRKMMLETIKFIDKVFIFDTEDELISLIKTLNPDIMVVGSDWKNKKVVGSEYAKELQFFQRIDKYSTTKILQSSPHR
jgi:D-beta-D-heptose 7-phosphate kinase/D-beta-D-heptose 1-phosphate adenosyltransferase